MYCQYVFNAKINAQLGHEIINQTYRDISNCRNYH